MCQKNCLLKNLKYFDVPNLSFFQPSIIWIFDGVELKALYFDEKELFHVWNEINKIHISCDGIKSNPNVELKGRLSKEEYIKGTFDFDSGDYNFEDFVKPIKIRGTSTFR